MERTLPSASPLLALAVLSACATAGVPVAQNPRPATDETMVSRPVESENVATALELPSLPEVTSRPADLVSLDLRDAEVLDVLRMLAEVGRVSVIATEDVDGTITIRLQDMPWEEALTVVTSSLHLAWQRQGDVVRVSTVEALQAEQERLQKLAETHEDLQPLEVGYLRLSFVHSDRLAALISGQSKGAEGSGNGILSDRGSVLSDPTTNTLIVRDTVDAIARVRELVGRIDIAAPQILIESSIVEASSDLSRSLGVQWGYREGLPAGEGAAGGNLHVGADPTGAVPYMVDFPADILPRSGGAFDIALGSLTGEAFELRLTALEREGKAKIISRPRVVTINNMPATIKSLTVIRVKLPSSETVVNTGNDSSISGSGKAATERIETGIILVVTPQVAADGQVLLDLFAKSSQADFSRSVDGIPTETSREASAHVRVADGQTVVLGGIYTDRDDERESGVPYLRSIPGLDWFFKRNDRSARREDLLVFLTPHIVRGPALAAVSPAAGR